MSRADRRARTHRRLRHCPMASIIAGRNRPPVQGSKTAGAAGFALDERRSPSTLAINDQTRRELPQRGNLRRRQGFGAE